MATGLPDFTSLNSTVYELSATAAQWTVQETTRKAIFLPSHTPALLYHQRDAFRLHPTYPHFVLRMRLLQSIFVVLPLSFFMYSG